MPPTTSPIDAVLARVSPRQRALLQRLRRAIRAAVPDAEECLSYGIPAFRLEGRVIAGFAATSAGGSYYPFSGTTLGTLAADLKGWSHTRSALHFTEARPLPAVLVRKLLAARRAEGAAAPRRAAAAKRRRAARHKSERPRDFVGGLSAGPRLPADRRAEAGFTGALRRRAGRNPRGSGGEGD